MENNLAVVAIGFLAQAFFSARILVQWIRSEKAHQVLSPSLFWLLSLAGSYLLFIYGWLRDDFAIVMGQMVSYYVYLWNLKLKGVWGKAPRALRWVLTLTPVVVLCFVASHAAEYFDKFFRNDSVPLWLLIFGSAGQILFTLRFVYQWIYSRRDRESALPKGFWVISLVGSLTIVSYGIMRHDIVLIVGQSFGLVAYVRNLVILHKSASADEKEHEDLNE